MDKKLARIIGELHKAVEFIELLIELGVADHERLARLESMFMFIMEKQGVETFRRATDKDKIEGQTPHTRVRVFRSQYDEWLEGWTAKVQAREQTLSKSNNKEQPHEQKKTDG